MAMPVGREHVDGIGAVWQLVIGVARTAVHTLLFVVP